MDIPDDVYKELFGRIDRDLGAEVCLVMSERTAIRDKPEEVQLKN